MSVDELRRLALALLLLVAVATAVGRRRNLEQGREVFVAVLRAIVQLVAVAAVVRVVFETPQLAPVYLVVMLGAASFTSSRRLRGIRHSWSAALAAIAAGAGTAAVAVFATGALAWSTRDLVPFTAQLVGGAMTATTLAGQRLRDDVAAHWERVEAWLALGATAREAVAELARVAAGRALVPAIDQTRNVGLVVLPGAFVGLLLGGATPLQAGRVQLLVLAGLLAAETVAAAVVTEVLAGALGSQRPAPA